MAPVVVTASWLETHRDDVVIADVRWYLDGRSARVAYEAGHVRGAVFVDLDLDLAAHDRPATSGRHPLPSPEAFAASMARLGISDTTRVVAYDDTGGMTAGRLVVMLRALGRSASLLDGGLAAWTEPLVTDVPLAPMAGFTPRPWPPRFIAEADELTRAQMHGAVLLDARASDRYRGENNSIDTRFGHIPGAQNLPWASVLADGRFRSVDDLRSLFATRGVGDGSTVIASCGSGVSACLDLLALEHAGLGEGALFVPSWSGWTADPARPAVIGPDPT